MPAYVIFPDRTLIEMAETRPMTMDQMARVSGVGAKKLERYGADFLTIIAGDAPAPEHPARMKLAGRAEGAIYDRLLEAQAELARGDGTGKPMSCSASLLAKIAALRTPDMTQISGILGERRAERFGPVFLDILENQ